MVNSPLKEASKILGLTGGEISHAWQGSRQHTRPAAVRVTWLCNFAVIDLSLAQGLSFN